MSGEYKHRKRHRVGDSLGWRCFYCDCPVRCVKCNPHTSLRLMATFDHVTAKANGGTDAYQNLVLACPGCNRRKADRDVHLTTRQRQLQAFGTLRRSENWKEGVQA